MGWGILDVYHLDEGDTHPAAMKPVGRLEAAARWCVFAPCALLALGASYYTIMLLGEGVWQKWFRVQSMFASPVEAPPMAPIYRFLFHLIAIGIASYMGVVLGSLAAPAHRGCVGAGLLSVLVLGGITQIGTLLLEGWNGQSLLYAITSTGLELWVGGCAVWSLARVFGWRGAPAIPATEYWKRLGRRGRRRAGLS